MTTSWPALLDALEEGTARASALLDGGEPVELPDVALEADGPMPPELRLRAVVLLSETDRLARRLADRRTALQRASAYASH